MRSFSVPARTPRTPKNRPEMAGTSGPGPPKNSPTVEPRIKSTKYRPKASKAHTNAQMQHAVSSCGSPEQVQRQTKDVPFTDAMGSRRTWLLGQTLCLICGGLGAVVCTEFHTDPRHPQEQPKTVRQTKHEECHKVFRDLFDPNVASLRQEVRQATTAKLCHETDAHEGSQATHVN